MSTNNPGILTKFKAHTHWHSSMRIERCTYTRETESFLFDQHGRRTTKSSDGITHHDSWEEAHQQLLAASLAKVQAARRALELANSYHGNIKGMKNPDARGE